MPNLSLFYYYPSTSYSSSDSTKLTIGANEEADIWVYTRSVEGAEFHVLDDNKRELVPVQMVKHTGGDEFCLPTRTQLTVTGKIAGPLVVKIKGVNNGGGMFSSSVPFLVVCNVSKK